MKLKLLQNLSGAKTYSVGDEIEATDLEAVRLISKGIAEAKTKKEHNDLMAKAEKLEKQAAEKQAKLIAIQKEEELKGEADALLDDIEAIIATVESINPKFRAEFIEHMNSRLSKGK